MKMGCSNSTPVFSLRNVAKGDSVIIVTPSPEKTKQNKVLSPQDQYWRSYLFFSKIDDEKTNVQAQLEKENEKATTAQISIPFDNVQEVISLIR